MTVTCIKKNTPLGGGEMTPAEAREHIGGYSDADVYSGMNAHLRDEWVKENVKSNTLMYFRNWYRGMYNEGRKRGLDMSAYSPVPPHRIS